jgi:hypothetical protein
MDARVGDEDDDRFDVGLCLVDAFVEKHFFAHTIGDRPATSSASPRNRYVASAKRSQVVMTVLLFSMQDF